VGPHPDPWESDPAFPPVRFTPSDRAQRVTAAEEANYRAAFLLNSSRRIEDAWRRGVAPADQAKREIHYWALHHKAAANRLAMARGVDVAAQSFGQVLGWYATLDDRTSTECRRAHGHNFRADQRPLIGWPGTVHPSCRCRPGVPFVNSVPVDSRVSRGWLRRVEARRAG
jgi:hypothetical protein